MFINPLVPANEVAAGAALAEIVKLRIKAKMKTKIPLRNWLPYFRSVVSVAIIENQKNLRSTSACALLCCLGIK